MFRKYRILEVNGVFIPQRRDWFLESWYSRDMTGFSWWALEGQLHWCSESTIEGAQLVIDGWNKGNKKLITKVHKAVYILAVALFLSCTPDEPTTPSTTPLDCNCGTVVESSSFNVMGSNGLSQFSIIVIKNDCTGVTRQVQKNGVVTIGTKICN